MFSCAFNNSLYRLMLANMTKQVDSYSPVHIENVVASLPLITHLLAKDEVERDFLEPLMTMIAIVILILMYWVRILLLSGQYLARERGKRRFFTICTDNITKK